MFVLVTGVYMAVIGAAVAVLLMLATNPFTSIAIRLFHRNSLMNYGMKLALIRSYSSKEAFPYGVAIAFGAVVTLFTKGVISL